MFQDAAVFLGVAAGIIMSELRKIEVSRPIGKRLASALPFLVVQPILARAPVPPLKPINARALFDSDRKRARGVLG